MSSPTQLSTIALVRMAPWCTRPWSSSSLVLPYDHGVRESLPLRRQNTHRPVTFTVNVLPVNDAPTLAFIPNLMLRCGKRWSVQTVPSLSGITAGDSEVQTLSVFAVSDNPSLIPSPTVAVNLGAGTGSLTYTPVSNASGTATITVTVQDYGGTDHGGVDTVTRTFTVTVVHIKRRCRRWTQFPTRPPSRKKPQPDHHPVRHQQRHGQRGAVQCSVSAVSSNTAIVPNPAVIYSSPNATVLSGITLPCPTLPAP